MSGVRAQAGVAKGRVGPVRPRAVAGRWRRIKSAVLVVTLLTLVVLPLLRWERGPGLSSQAVLFDFSTARAYVLASVFGPQDLVLLLGALLVGAFLLFLTNTLVGRVWCGFTCPQTLWTDLFVIIERWIGPGRSQDAAWRLHLTRFLWAAIAVITSLSIVGYFTDARLLWTGIFAGEASPVATFFVLLFAIATYVLAGHARELVCLHMCPWPRFQAAMSDAATLSVTYRAGRGEPRGPLKRARADQTAVSGREPGDCVDCGFCVAVCPTGIDIRNGPQLGCIGCGLCADACDDVMRKIARPTGLVGFFPADQEVVAGAVARPGWRWKPIGFAALALVAIATMAVHLAGRDQVVVSVAPERQPPFIRLSDGSIRNAYALRLDDRRSLPGELHLSVEGLEGARLDSALGRNEAGPSITVPVVGTRSIQGLRVTLTLPPALATPGRRAVAFVLTAPGNEAPIARVETYFWAPDMQGGRP